MSKYPCFLCSISLPMATVLGMALTITPQTSVLGRETARLDGFTQADGGNVFALTLKPSATAFSGPRDVVILVNTAASETGEYRTKSLAALYSFLANLDPGDRVKLVAFDLNAAALTHGFVPPQSVAMTAALAALHRRTPLGACDLEKALDTAAKSFSSYSQSPRAIVYIGDGSSRANSLGTERLDRVVSDLVAQRAPVIALGVGPQIEEQMLGTLASRTGGIFAPEVAQVDAIAYGAGLARAVHGSVLWPKAGASVKWPKGMDIYPKTLPPLRSDRNTVLVGTMVGAAKTIAAAQVEIELDGPTGPQKLEWDIPAWESDAKNGYLTTLVEQATSDGGRTLPLIDSASLATAKQEIEAGGRGLTHYAWAAFHSGNLESAERLASAALSRNPNDREARAIKDAIAKTPAAAGPVADKPQQPTPAAPGDLNLQGGNAGVPPPDGAAAAQEIHGGAALEEQWQKAVQNTINRARNQVAFDPAEAKVIIQNRINDITTETELRPETREQLIGMLRIANGEIKHRMEQIALREQFWIREVAAGREMEMTNAALERDEEKFKQSMERYDALMAEGRYHLAEEVAVDARSIVNRSLPGAGPLTDDAQQMACLAGAYGDIMAVRVAAQKGYVDAMYQIEIAQAPTPDDPPIVYPRAEIWKELSARRGVKYSAADLSRRSPAEKKIEEALKQPTQIEFVETPLKDVVEYLKDLHHIEIQLDSAALKAAGIAEDTPVTKNLKGISLRSALKLLLDDLQLKYVIHNEVLLITTADKAQSDEFLIPKVYPAADIVLPIKEAGFKGGFGNLGGPMNPATGTNQMDSNNPFTNSNQGNPFGNQRNQGNPFGNNNQGQFGNNLFNVPR